MDNRIDAPLCFHDAADERAKERTIRRPQLLALDLFAEPVCLELSDDGRQGCPARVHLVKRLHSAKPRHASLIGRAGRHHLASLPFSQFRFECDHRESRFSRRTALIQLTHPRTHPSLVVVLDGQDTVADRKSMRDGEIHERSRRFVRDGVVVCGLPSNDTAEGDIAIEFLG